MKRKCESKWSGCTNYAGSARMGHVCKECRRYTRDAVRTIRRDKNPYYGLAHVTWSTYKAWRHMKINGTKAAYHQRNR